MLEVDKESIAPEPATANAFRKVYASLQAHAFKESLINM